MAELGHQRFRRFRGHAQHLGEVQLFLLQLDLAAGDARHVHQVVDQSHHVVRLALHQEQRLLADVRGDLFGAQQADAVADRGEGVAQFVRQYRQELVLAPVGQFQRLFDALAFGDVGQGQHGAANAAVRVVQKAGRQDQVADVAVVRIDHFPAARVRLGDDFGETQRKVVSADVVAQRQGVVEVAVDRIAADQILDRLTGAADAARPVADDDGVGHLVQDRLGQDFLGNDLVTRPFGRDVGQQQARARRIVLQRAHGERHRYALAGRVAQQKLGLGLALGADLQQDVQGGHAGRRDQVLGLGAFELVVVAMDQGRERFIRLQDAAVQRQERRRMGHLGQDQLIALFRRAERQDLGMILGLDDHRVDLAGADGAQGFPALFQFLTQAGVFGKQRVDVGR